MEPDSLATLEERIRSAVEVVTQLRREKDAALRAAAEAGTLKQRMADLAAEVDSARLERDVLKSECDTLKSERDALKSERENVRRRVEKLLEQIDALGAG